MSAWVEPSIDVIGIDDSGPECLTDSQRSLIDRADLLCGGVRHLALFGHCAGERFTVTADLGALYARLDRCVAGTAAVLASGDPCFFGIGPSLVERFGRKRVKIHPRPTSVATAFARLGLSWQDATVVSVHGRPVFDAVPAVLRATKIAVLTDPEHTPAAVATALRTAGMNDCPAFVCERLGGPRETIHELTLSALPSRVFDPLNVLILLPAQRPPDGAAIGRPDSAYASVRGQITKSEIRVVTISRLEPWRAGVCWDVGAGCGSVSIETAGLMAAPTVYAVERDREQSAVLRQNLEAHHAVGVRIVEASAPAALESLPAPDAVFVGGGGRDLLPILQFSAGRLNAGGRLIANFALLESLGTWQTFAASTGWPSDISQIAVARSESLADGTHLTPLAPVFVTRLVKPDSKP